MANKSTDEWIKLGLSDPEPKSPLMFHPDDQHAPPVEQAGFCYWAIGTLPVDYFPAGWAGVENIPDDPDADQRWLDQHE